jgi:hypothetical protein
MPVGQAAPPPSHAVPVVWAALLLRAAENTYKKNFVRNKDHILKKPV